MPLPPQLHAGDVVVQWRRFVDGLAPDAPLRPVILDSWHRSKAAGVAPEPARIAPSRVAPEELERRLLASAELIELARPHLEWLSSSHGSIPHVAYLVDRDGIVLHVAGTDAEAVDATGLLPGSDWSETAMGTNGAGTALAAGVAVAVEGPEHFARPLHRYACAGAPVRGPEGDVAGAIGISTDAHHASAERLLVVAHAAYAITQELRYRDSLRRTSGQLEAERRLAEERAQRLAALEALQESEARFRGAFDHAAIAKVITTPEGTLTRVNLAMCELVGRPEDELIGSTFQSITHPDDLPSDLDLLRRVLAGEIDRCQLDKRLLHEDGHAVWVTMNAVAVRDAAGAPLYFVVQYQDISERKRAEAALRESEARYEHIAANVPGVVYQFVYWPDGRKGYTYVSESARTVLGVSPEDALRDPSVLLGLIHPEEYPHFVRLAREAAAVLGHFRWEGRLVLPSGEERLVYVAAHDHLQTDGGVASDGLVMDVTELRRAAQRLEESEQRYRSLFDHHPDAVYSIDTEGRFLSANPACETISGYAPAELIGRSFEPLVDPEQRAIAAEHFQAAVAGSAQRFEVAIRHKAGHRVEIDVTNIPMVVGGAVMGIFGIARDLTMQRALEAQLRQAQKMEAVGQLAGGIAHDFNNILAAITGFAELLRESIDATDTRQEDIAEILKGTRRAASLTRQLLAFSRKQLLQPEVLDLNQVVSQMATMLRPLLGAPLHVVTLTAPHAVPVFADRTQLEQVLMNLALNARDAMPDGGTLTIEVDSRPATPDAPAAATLIVRDTGVGMSPAVEARAFEPFFTTKPPGRGTGLGLATVHGIVQQSGGTIRVLSREGEGTTFTITLPLTQPTIGETSSSRSAGQDRGMGTVLLVEDEEAVRAIARRVLERAGYRVLTARHGRDALQILAEQSERVDVLLSDVVMPEMGGVELAEQVMQRTPGMKIILMSGYTHGDLGTVGQDGPIAGFVSKPFTAESLLKAMHDVAPSE